MTQLTLIPPGLVEMVADDPALAEPIVRKLAMKNLENTFLAVQAGDAIGPRIELQKILNKMGRLEPGNTLDGAGGGGFVFNINFSDRPRVVHVEQKPIEGEHEVISE